VEIKEAGVKKREINWLVWVVPIVSLLVGGWLLFKYYSGLGPLIEIYFENSGGLEPKKSIVRFRDVKVGVVEDIHLLKKGVLVKVRMHKDVKPFLNYTTKFWIVRPVVELGKIKGLEALVSGPYIQMYAKEGKFSKKKFEGYMQEPLDLDILHAKIFRLYAKSSYSLSEKMPIYYKDVKVGSIKKVILHPSNVEIIVSVNKKYAFLVNDSTKFWNLRGIDISLNKDTLKIDIPGISQILIGGIEFETPDLNASLTKKKFKLYAGKGDAFKNSLGEEIYKNVKVTVTDDKNALIKVGDGIYFKDFLVGYVSDIVSKLDIKTLKVISVCNLKIDISAFGGEKGFDFLLQQGLVAKVVKGMPVLEGVRIELFLDSKYKNSKVLKVVKVKENDIMKKISLLLDKLNGVDYNRTFMAFTEFFEDNNPKVGKLLDNINKGVVNFNEFVSSKDFKNLPLKLNKTLNTVNCTLKSYSKDSVFYIKLNEILKDTHKSLKLFQKIEKKIDNKPNVLIFGE